MATTDHITTADQLFEARTVTLYAGESPPVEFEESGQITGGHVLPGLELTIADIFAR